MVEGQNSSLLLYARASKVTTPPFMMLVNNIVYVTVFVGNEPREALLTGGDLLWLCQRIALSLVHSHCHCQSLQQITDSLVGIPGVSVSKG